MKKILLTGGAGFIGSHTAKALIKKGNRVVIIDNFNDYYDSKIKEARISQLLSGLKFKLYRADICDETKMDCIIKKEKPDQICHLAAQAGVRYSLKNPYAYINANITGTVVLLELAKKYQIKDFIFASSSSVYGGNTKLPFSEEDRVDTPISIYAATKKADELIAYTYHHLYGINCTGLRFFTVYGPYGRPDMALFKFTKQILADDEIEVYNFGKMKRDFTYIDDIVSGVVKALEKSYPYEIFNLGNSKMVQLNYFISCIENELGKTAKKKLMSIQAGDVPETNADITKAQKMLGYKPITPINKGISKFISWYTGYFNNIGTKK